MWHQSAIFENSWTPFCQIWIIFTHLMDVTNINEQLALSNFARLSYEHHQTTPKKRTHPAYYAGQNEFLTYVTNMKCICRTTTRDARRPLVFVNVRCMLMQRTSTNTNTTDAMRSSSVRLIPPSVTGTLTTHSSKHQMFPQCRFHVGPTLWSNVKPSIHEILAQR